MPPEHAAAFEKAMAVASVPCASVGRVIEAKRLTLRAVSGDRDVVSAPLDALRDAWRGALPFDLEEGAR